MRLNAHVNHLSNRRDAIAVSNKLREKIIVARALSRP